MPLLGKRFTKSTGGLLTENSSNLLHTSIEQLQRDLLRKDLIIQDLMYKIEKMESFSTSSSQGVSQRTSCTSSEGGQSRRRTFSCVNTEDGQRRRSRLGSFLAKVSETLKKPITPITYNTPCVPQNEAIEVIEVYPEITYPEYSYYDLSNGLVRDCNPEHLERYLSDEDCIEYLGIPRDWLPRIPKEQLETLKERTSLTSRHYKYRVQCSKPLDSPTRTNIAMAQSPTK